MFQYALAKAFARHRGDSFRLDLVFLLDRTPRPHFVFRNYDLDIFGLHPPVTGLSRLAQRLPVPMLHFAAGHAWTILQDKLGICRRIVERSFGFHPEIFEEKGSVYLEGWWQSEKYFAPIQEEIRKEFTSFAHPLPAEAESLAERIAALDSICLNVRRTDYVTNPGTSQLMGSLGTEYYDRAVASLAGGLANPHVFIFSDDIAWCSENLHFPVPHTFVGHEIAGPKFSHYLQLMIRCKHFIIPNSTFAWWAAWLGEKKGTRIIAPSSWIKGEKINDSDVVPLRWDRL